MPRKILIVEDDIALYNMYSTELQLRGFEVVNVSNGGQAVDAVRKEKPDLILLDVMLPEKNGLDILEELKQDDELKNYKVVMLTNYGTDENISRAVELGAEDYIMKYNIVPSELSGKVQSIMGEVSNDTVKLFG
jgi:DNA-binding response OmpR family regulator